jgi:hypothetical protein
MFGTQISAICSDQTGIESLKTGNGRRGGSADEENTNQDKGGGGTAWKNMQVVFGGGGGQRFSARWLVSLSIQL